ncbi:unnamed protein product [Schistocephalus solidus]|uniref:Secreted protein n=1 Tax=Schistocephalus solidus TaxID=70667 RepID=A0A183TQU1_SCHSO|nr:unnamed protein product [Schistocephalus solidus]
MNPPRSVPPAFPTRLMSKASTLTTATILIETASLPGSRLRKTATDCCSPNRPCAAHITKNITSDPAYVDGPV